MSITEKYIIWFVIGFLSLSFTVIAGKPSRDKDYDVIFTFEDIYTADSSGWKDNSNSMCGIVGGANIPRQDGKDFFAAAFDCLFDSTGAVESVVVDSTTVTGMSANLRRNSNNEVIEVTLWVKTIDGIDYSGTAETEHLTIQQNESFDSYTIDVYSEIDMAAQQKGKKGNGSVLPFKLFLNNITLCVPEQCP